MAFMDIPKPASTVNTLAPQAIPSATSLPTPKVLQISLWVPPYLAETLGSTLPDPLRGLFVSDATLANIRLEVGEQNLVSRWVYALVTPFPSTLQGVSGDDLLSSWHGNSGGIFGGQPLLMDQITYEMFSAHVGTGGQARAYRSWRKMS